MDHLQDQAPDPNQSQHHFIHSANDFGLNQTSSSSSSNVQIVPSSSSQQQDPSPPKTKRKVRKNLSCTECKKRKTKCSRTVPGCENCVKLGIQHLCKWGDERDEESVQEASTISALLAKIAKLESDNLKLEKRLLSATTTTSSSSTSSSSPGNSSSITQQPQPRIRSYTHSSQSESPVLFDGFRSSTSSNNFSLKRKGKEKDDGSQRRFGIKEEEEDEVSGTGSGAQAIDFEIEQLADELEGFWWTSPDATAVKPASSLSDLRQQDEISTIRSIISTLPKPNVTNRLLEYYYHEIEIYRGCLHWPTFQKDLQNFWFSILDPNSSTTEPDLSFASLLFSIITCAASLLLEPELKAIGISLPTKESYTNLLDQWNIATMDLLRLSRFYEKPNVNSLLAIISMRIYSHRRNKWGPYILLSSLALRAAELIGLDKLGTAREDEIRWQKDRELEKAGTPPPKRTEYGSGSHILREVGRRVYVSLRYYDLLMSYRVGFGNHVPVQSTKRTGMPSQLEDEQILEGGQPLPSDVTFSPSSRLWIPHVFGLALLSPKIREASQPGTSYSQVLSVTSEIEAHLESLPIFLKIDGNSENSPEVIHWIKERPYLLSLRNSYQQIASSMKLFLHRRFFSAGYKEDSPYQFSTRQCLKAAHFTLSVLLNTPAGYRNSQDVKFFRHEKLFLPDEAFGAASILLLHLLQDHVKADEARRALRDVDVVVDFIQSFVDEGFVSNHGRMVAVLRSFKNLVVHHRRSKATFDEKEIFQLPVRPLPHTSFNSDHNIRLQNQTNQNHQHNLSEDAFAAQISSDLSSFQSMDSFNNFPNVTHQTQFHLQQPGSNFIPSGSTLDFAFTSNPNFDQSQNQNQQGPQFFQSNHQAQTYVDPNQSLESSYDPLPNQNYQTLDQESQRQMQAELDAFVNSLTAQDSESQPSFFPVLDQMLFASR